MKIVYLVSQKFKESQPCKMETLYGIAASHKQCENSLIPVLLEPIEMPRELQTINYVDGTLDGTDKACKIYKACLFGDMSNGMPLRVIRRIEETVWCIPITRFSEDMTKRKRVKDEARSLQIKADSIILGFIYRNQTLLANWFGLEDFKTIINTAMFMM
uniref:Uncharacterized protein n=1 Tax=Magallana gigas TaxID=29159 RepID=K1QVT1_MAGGI